MVVPNRSGYAPEADIILLTDLWPQQTAPDGKSPRPYPFSIINTNAILVNDDDRKNSSRGGDSFILTPLFTASNATGWIRTRSHMRRYGPLSLASAMAASGAAANANSGYLGSGITRDRVVSVLMIMLNLGLGLWLANPAKPKPNPLLKVPNHWYPGFVYGVLRGGYRRDSRFLELSDGGHFDNLGLYELVRRQARVILVLDAESDPEFSFRALVSAAQRIKDDFRATIKFTPDDGPERLVGDSKLKYPNAA